MEEFWRFLSDSINKAEAFQFLNQTTFGATEGEAQRLSSIGIEAWVDDQLQQPASLQLPHLRSLPRPQFLFELQADRIDNIDNFVVRDLGFLV